MNPLLSLFGAMAGGCLGSFASAQIWAWLNGQSLDGKRSVCNACQKKLNALELVPVFSYLALRGRCGKCGHKIPAFHFWVELLSALAGACFAARYGFDWRTVLYTLVAAALAAASAADFYAHVLPDSVTLGSLALVPFILLANPELSPLSALIGYAVGGGIPLLLWHMFKLLRHKDCLGLGDVKLFALGGALTGWQALPFLCFFAAAAGILAFACLCAKAKTISWNSEIPFGPFICTAIFFILLFPDLPRIFYACLIGF